MTKYLKTLTIVASLAAATTAYAAAPAQTFTPTYTVDEWNAAVLGMKVGVEHFDDASIPDFKITTHYTKAGVSDGVYHDFDTQYNSTTFDFSKTFPNGIRAFGANWNLGPLAPGSGLTLWVNGAQVGTIDSNYAGGFLGFVSNKPFTTVTVARWSTAYEGEHYTVDNVSYAAPVPEPETYAMFVAGLGLLGAVARRRKQQD